MADHGRPPHVLVVGAGIGGLTAALELAGTGAKVTVVERAPQLVAVGAGVQLSPNATRILGRLGVLESLGGRATRPSGIRVRSGRSGRTLSFMSLAGAEQRWGAPYLVARRADLQDALMQVVSVSTAIEVCLGTSLAGFGVSPRGVQASLKQGQITRSIQADVLVGADGVRSTVRSKLIEGGSDDPPPARRLAWRALIDAESVADLTVAGETGLWLGPEAHLVHYPVDGGRRINMVAVTRDAGSGKHDPGWSGAGNTELLRKRFARWHTTARRLIAGAEAWTTWPLSERAPLAAWNAGPIALLGDAAHPILPFLAQGAAQAIEDAAALASALGATRDVAEALASYSRTRIPRASRVQATSRRLGDIYHLTGPAAFARNAAIRAMGGHRLLAQYDWLYAPHSAVQVTSLAARAY